MKWISFMAFFLSFSAFASLQRVEKDSVVEIFVECSLYDSQRPWSRPETKEKRGSGFIVEVEREGNVERYIMTNAHLVTYASSIRVFSESQECPYDAEVVVADHDCDLAILKTKDPSFFEEKRPLSFASTLVGLGEDVTVYGFSIGGSRLCQTSGKVSRTETMLYPNSLNYLLATQIDAPINFGSSGSPVVSRQGTVVGVVYQGFEEGQNIGYMVPIPIIQHFMEDLKQGPYFGFPQNFLGLQLITNSHARAHYGLEKGEGAFLVTRVPKNYFFSESLQVGDLILGVDGYPLSFSGLVEMQNWEGYFSFQEFFATKHFGQRMRLKVMRAGNVLFVESTLPPRLRGRPLIHQDFNLKRHTYYVYAGLVFQPVTRLASSEKLTLFLLHSDITDHSARLCAASFFTNFIEAQEERRELVFLSNILNGYAAGYRHLKDAIVKSVDQKLVIDMRHFVELIEDHSSPFVEIEFLCGHKIIFERQVVESETQAALDQYRIPADRSQDLF